MELKYPLQEYGLGEKEIKVYLELLPLGTVTIHEIVKRLGFPRSTIYHTLEYLISRGIVAKIIKKNIYCAPCSFMFQPPLFCKEGHFKCLKEVTPEELHRGGNVGGEGIPMGTAAYSDSSPLVSEGLGCMKSQVPEMREDIRKHNIKGVRVLDSGQLEITSRRGRAKLCRMRGKCDAEGGYGDG